jgi:hypothetical protein
MKKEWEEPELIVLIKTELEEDVLAGCKQNEDNPACASELGPSKDFRPS